MPTIEYQRPELYQKQFEAIFADTRYSAIEASTKAGKTAGSLVWLWEQAALQGREGRNYWWVAPVYSQAKIAYNRMRRSMPRGLFKANASDMTVTLANGALIWFKSGEKPDNLYGEDVYAAVIDEASRLREESWHAVRSTLTKTRGPVRMIGNVKGRWNWFYSLCREIEAGRINNASYHKLTWEDAVEAGVLDLAEIEDARATLPDHVFRELYEAEAADIAGRVYHKFTQKNIAPVEDDGSELRVGMDFNVNPMSAVLAVRVADQLHVFDEIELNNSNTEEMAQNIRDRFPGRRTIVYPDPAGNQRRSSAPVGQTDLSILERYGFELDVASGPIPVSDRINEVNAMFETADGTRRCFINPRCVSLIQCLERLAYKDGKSLYDKNAGLDHLPDALGYLIHQEFPIIERGFIFEAFRL